MARQNPRPGSYGVRRSLTSPVSTFVTPTRGQGGTQEKQIGAAFGSLSASLANMAQDEGAEATRVLRESAGDIAEMREKGLSSEEIAAKVEELTGSKRASRRLRGAIKKDGSMKPLDDPLFNVSVAKNREVIRSQEFIQSHAKELERAATEYISAGPMNGGSVSERVEAAFKATGLQGMLEENFGDEQVGYGLAAQARMERELMKIVHRAETAAEAQMIQTNAAGSAIQIEDALESDVDDAGGVAAKIVDDTITSAPNFEAGAELATSALRSLEASLAAKVKKGEITDLDAVAILEDFKDASSGENGIMSIFDWALPMVNGAIARFSPDDAEKGVSSREADYQTSRAVSASGMVREANSFLESEDRAYHFEYILNRIGSFSEGGEISEADRAVYEELGGTYDEEGLADPNQIAVMQETVRGFLNASSDRAAQDIVRDERQKNLAQADAENGIRMGLTTGLLKPYVAMHEAIGAGLPALAASIKENYESAGNHSVQNLRSYAATVEYETPPAELLELYPGLGSYILDSREIRSVSDISNFIEDANKRRGVDEARRSKAAKKADKNQITVDGAPVDLPYIGSKEENEALGLPAIPMEVLGARETQDLGTSFSHAMIEESAVNATSAQGAFLEAVMASGSFDTHSIDLQFFGDALPGSRFTRDKDRDDRGFLARTFKPTKAVAESRTYGKSVQFKDREGENHKISQEAWDGLKGSMETAAIMSLRFQDIKDVGVRDGFLTTVYELVAAPRASYKMGPGETDGPASKHEYDRKTARVRLEAIIDHLYGGATPTEDLIDQLLTQPYYNE